MADGTFAAALVLLGLTEMGASYCGTEEGCLARSDVEPRLSVSVGEVLKRQAMPASELYLRRDLGRNFGPFGTATGFSLGENGEFWAGYGATLTYDFWGSPFFVELHFIPGIYTDNGGFDLGGPTEFRSGIEFGIKTHSGWRLGIGYDHRSNGGIFTKNPGIETVHLRMGVPDR